MSQPILKHSVKQYHAFQFYPKTNEVKPFSAQRITVVYFNLLVLITIGVTAGLLLIADEKSSASKWVIALGSFMGGGAVLTCFYTVFHKPDWWMYVIVFIMQLISIGVCITAIIIK